jgi:AhpD family alkylhydroperoxidase
MKRLRGVTCCFLAASMLTAGELRAEPAITALAALDEQARQRVKPEARVALLPESSELFQGIESLEPAGSGRVPNYLRALTPLPESINFFAHLIKTFVYDGTLAPETKLGMALRVAQINNSPYTAAHVQRMLRTSERGKSVLAAIKASRFSSLPVADGDALRYAEALTRDVHGPAEAEFRKIRGSFNDSQIVELVFTVCFFNYFTRYAEALHLPVEPWVLNSDAAAVPAKASPPARIALVSDEEMTIASELLAGAKDPARQAAMLNMGIANSLRAMMLVPALSQAWRSGFRNPENPAVDRGIKLQISFAVSMANGCRYCTLHQVLGLRRLGVNPSKLMAMKKDDSELTPRELTAVTFARKVTAKPGGITDTDYDSVRKEFGEKGALEVLMQTCNFAFMNRFTDGLRLPSEDEAIRVYRETYGGDFQR